MKLHTRLARLLAHMADLPGGERLPSREERDRAVEAWHAEVARAEGYPTLQEALHAGLGRMPTPPLPRHNALILYGEMDHYKRQGPTVAELLRQIHDGAAELAEVNARGVLELAERLRCPDLAEAVASGGDRWPAWPWIANGWDARPTSAGNACLALRLLCRWTWLRSGAETPEDLLPREEWSTVGYWPDLQPDAALAWCPTRLGREHMGYWLDWLTEGSWPDAFGWSWPRTVPGMGIAAFHAAWLAHPWLEVWETMARLATPEATGDPTEIHRALAAEHTGAGEENKASRDALALELLRELQAFQREHMAGPPEEPRELKDAPGLLWLDELAARFLETRGAHGAKQAEELRRKATARWTDLGSSPSNPAAWVMWLPLARTAAAPFALMLARCLWARTEAERKKAKEEERKRAEEEREEERKRLERLGTAALPRALVLGVSAALRGAKAIASGPYAIHDPHHIEPVGSVSLVENWEEVLGNRAALDRALLAEHMLKMLKALNTVAAARLPRLVASTVNGLARLKRNPQILEWFHGLEGLGAALHLTPEQQRDLSDALDAFRSLNVPLPDGSTQHGLWTWNLVPHAPRRPAILRLELPIVWIPGYTAMLKDQNKRARESGRPPVGTPEDRRLVYLSAPERIPGPVGSGRGQPAQERLILLTHRDFSDRSMEYAAQGGLPDDDVEWRRRADEAGIGKRSNTLELIRAGWIQPAQVPIWALLERLPNGLLRMADEEVHKCLMRQGHRRNSASKGGKAPRDPEPWKKKGKRKPKR